MVSSKALGVGQEIIEMSTFTRRYYWPLLCQGIEQVFPFLTYTLKTTTCNKIPEGWTSTLLKL
jgi:hypothetical protein